MFSMPSALQRIKGRLGALVPQSLIHRLCLEVGHQWRERDLGPVVTTYLFLQQLLHGNPAVGELRRLTGLTFTDSAYCQARARLPRLLLERLQQAVTGHSQADPAVQAQSLWHGHRVFLI